MLQLLGAHLILGHTRFKLHHVRLHIQQRAKGFTYFLIQGPFTLHRHGLGQMPETDMASPFDRAAIGLHRLPLRRWSSVLFPLPLAPIRPILRPASMCQEMLCRTVMPAKVLVMFSVRSSVIEISLSTLIPAVKSLAKAIVSGSLSDCKALACFL